MGQETGDFRGYEVDLLREIQQRLGVQLGYRRAFWSVIVGELTSGEIDVVCSAATVTEERKREVDFCRPHLDTSLAVVRLGDDSSAIDLRGTRVGVRHGTTAEAHVRADGTATSTMLLESNDGLYAALSKGEIDAVVDDSPIAAYFVRTWFFTRPSGTLPSSAYAIGIRDPLTGVRVARCYSRHNCTNG